MGRGYLNVRATGGAVEPLPWRGLRGLGRRSKPSWQRGLGDRKKAKRSLEIEKKGIYQKNGIILANIELNAYFCTGYNLL